MADSVPAPRGSEVDKLQNAKAEEAEIVKEAKNAGVPAFQFDADATPAEKAAQAEKVLISARTLLIEIWMRLMSGEIASSARTRCPAYQGQATSGLRRNLCHYRRCESFQLRVCGFVAWDLLTAFLYIE